MRKEKLAAAVVAVVLVGVLLCGPVLAAEWTDESDFAAQVDSAYTNATTPQNRQKMFSILIFLVLGGTAVYAEMRGIKKFVSG